MTTFHNISFYGASQVLRFLQMEGMTLHQQKAQDLLSGDIWNGGLPGFVPPGLARHRAILLEETLVYFLVTLTSQGAAIVYFLLFKAHRVHSSSFSTSAKSGGAAPNPSCDWLLPD